MAQTVPVVLPPVELTGATLGPFEAEVLEYVAAQVAGVVVDLAVVRFVDSTGLGVLVKAGLRLDAQEKRLALARPSEAVARAIRIVGLDQILRIFPSVQSASAFVLGASH